MGYSLAGDDSVLRCRSDVCVAFLQIYLYDHPAGDKEVGGGGKRPEEGSHHEEKNIEKTPRQIVLKSNRALSLAGDASSVAPFVKRCRLQFHIRRRCIFYLPVSPPETYAHVHYDGRLPIVIFGTAICPNASMCHRCSVVTPPHRILQDASPIQLYT